MHAAGLRGAPGRDGVGVDTGRGAWWLRWTRGRRLVGSGARARPSSAGPPPATLSLATARRARCVRRRARAAAAAAARRAVTVAEDAAVTLPALLLSEDAPSALVAASAPRLRRFPAAGAAVTPLIAADRRRRAAAGRRGARAGRAARGLAAAVRGGRGSGLLFCWMPKVACTCSRRNKRLAGVADPLDLKTLREHGQRPPSSPTSAPAGPFVLTRPPSRSCATRGRGYRLPQQVRGGARGAPTWLAGEPPLRDGAARSGARGWRHAQRTARWSPRRRRAPRRGGTWQGRASRRA